MVGRVAAKRGCSGQREFFAAIALGETLQVGKDFGGESRAVHLDPKARPLFLSLCPALNDFTNRCDHPALLRFGLRSAFRAQCRRDPGTIA